MNPLTLWMQSRTAAPYLRAVLGSRRSLKMKKVALEPCRIPAPVAIPVRRPRVLAALVVAMLGLSVVSAHAQNWSSRSQRGSDWDWVADGRLVDVSVVVDGSDAPLYTGPSAPDRKYFQAFQGRNYALVVRNNTGQRVGVLLAVDGLNVVNGQRSRLDSREPMYVLDPYETTTIRGWRTSLSEVRRFVFVDEERSYAERTGQANGDMGWIRVNSFRESRPLAWRDWVTPGPRPYQGGEPRGEMAPESRADGERAPQKDGARQYGGEQSNPGTGWGDRRHDPVQETEFLAERVATDRITLRYEYASGLRALGIFPRRNRTWERERGELGFAPQPRW